MGLREMGFGEDVVPLPYINKIKRLFGEISAESNLSGCFYKESS
jgi:hypothetical protein